MVSVYHSPVQQPCFSGALKVTRVEQMAQFPQSFRINESLLQRNANFQTLDCLLKQDWGRRRKKRNNNISFSHFRNRLNMPCSGITQFHRMLPLHNGSLIGFGVSEQRVSMWKICTIWHPCHCAMRRSYGTSCWLHFDIIAMLCGTSSLIKKKSKKVKYFVDKNRNSMEWRLFFTYMIIATSNTHCAIFVVV